MKEMTKKQLVSVAACICAAVVLLQPDMQWFVKLEKFNITQEFKKKEEKQERQDGKALIKTVIKGFRFSHLGGT